MSVNSSTCGVTDAIKAVTLRTLSRHVDCYADVATNVYSAVSSYGKGTMLEGANVGESRAVKLT